MGHAVMGSGPMKVDNKKVAFMKSGPVKTEVKTVKKEEKVVKKEEGSEESSLAQIIGGIQAAKLKTAGYETLESLPNTLDELLEIEGVGKKTAEAILALK